MNSKDTTTTGYEYRRNYLTSLSVLDNKYYMLLVLFDDVLIIFGLNLHKKNTITSDAPYLELLFFLMNHLKVNIVDVSVYRFVLFSNSTIFSSHIGPCYSECMYSEKKIWLGQNSTKQQWV